MRINRNIVECKESSFSFDTDASVVLIETLWNVKEVRSLSLSVPLSY